MGSDFVRESAWRGRQEAKAGQELTIPVRIPPVKRALAGVVVQFRVAWAPGP